MSDGAGMPFGRLGELAMENHYTGAHGHRYIRMHPALLGRMKREIPPAPVVSGVIPAQLGGIQVVTTTEMVDPMRWELREIGSHVMVEDGTMSDCSITVYHEE